MMPGKTTYLCLALAFIAPVAAYLFLVRGVSFVEAAELNRLVERTDTVRVYVGEDTHRGQTLEPADAQPWPLAEIASVQRVDDLPRRLSEKKLLLMSSGGWKAILAARHLNTLDDDLRSRIRVARGGQQAILSTLHPSDTPSGLENYLERSTIVQWVSFGAGFVIKPAYMLLSLALMIFLIRSRDPQPRMLAVAMGAFLFGESFCTVNYVLFDDRSLAMEYLHMFGMSMCFSVTVIWLLLQGRQMLTRPGEEGPCSLMQQCKECTRTLQNDCKHDRLYLPAILSFMVLNAILLLAEFTHSFNVSVVLDVPYAYVHPVMTQLYEVRAVPLISLVLLLCSMVLYWTQRKQSVFPLLQVLGVAIGFFCFGGLRLLLVAVFPDFLWAIVFEELTELLFIVLVVWGLWLFYPGVFPFASRAKIQGEAL